MLHKKIPVKLMFITSFHCFEEHASSRELLQHYKDQHKVERGFTFLKNPYYVGPVFLKKPERIEASSHVFLLTLLVYSIFERRVRLGLREEGEPFHVADSYRTFTPTGKTVLEPMDELHIATFFEQGGAVRKIPDNVSEKVLRILRLCGFTIEIYVSPPKPVLRE